MTENGNLVVSSEWHLRFEHTLGPAATSFLTALRDDERMLASYCDSCSRTIVPPRDFCEQCFVPLTVPEKELPTTGTIKGYTIIYAELPGYRKPPYAVAYVEPDGADTAIGNYLEGVDLDDPRAAAGRITVGSRARAVFAADRHGKITDFHWELVP